MIKKGFLAICVLVCATSVMAETPVIDLSQSASQQDEQRGATTPAPREETPIFSEETAPQKLVRSEEPSAESSSHEKMDLLSQIQTLQNEIKQLRGQIEVQNHDMKMLNEQQSSLYKDLDSRLHHAATSQEPQNSEQAKVAAIEKPSASYVTSELSSSAQQQDDKDGEALYQSAFTLVRDKKYPEAAAAMESFVQTYPQSQYTSNGYYWLGELYLAQGFVEKAMEQFNRVIHDFPTSIKASGAMLKLGYVYYDQSRWLQARAQFNQVIKKFPDASEARLAKSRILELDRQGL